MQCQLQKQSVVSLAEASLVLITVAAAVAAGNAAVIRVVLIGQFLTGVVFSRE